MVLIVANKLRTQHINERERGMDRAGEQGREREWIPQSTTKQIKCQTWSFIFNSHEKKKRTLSWQKTEKKIVAKQTSLCSFYRHFFSFIPYTLCAVCVCKQSFCFCFNFNDILCSSSQIKFSANIIVFFLLLFVVFAFSHPSVFANEPMNSMELGKKLEWITLLIFTLFPLQFWPFT